MLYVSPQVEKSPCLIEQAQLEKQSGAMMNARAFLERYLTEWRDTNLGKHLDGLSREKSGSLAEIIEPLSLANRDADSEVLPKSGESTLLRPSEKAIRSLACSEKDSSWLKRLAGGSRLVVQAFRIRGTAAGETLPMILFWKKEKSIWRVVAVGTIQD